MDARVKPGNDGGWASASNFYPAPNGPIIGTHAIECRMFQARTEDIAAERRPVAFGDLRGFIEALKAQGELAEIDAEVDWNIELGTIMRLAQGPGTGKALIFNNIKDYNTPASRCRRIFGSALNNYRRIAMMLGLPPDTHPRELVKVGRTILNGSVAPKIVATGPVKENVLRARTSISTSFLRPIGIDSTAGAISSPTAAASPRIPKPES